MLYVLFCRTPEARCVRMPPQLTAALRIVSVALASTTKLDHCLLLRCDRAQNDTWQTTKHESGVCALYGTAGHRPDGDALDKPQNTRAARVSVDSYAELQASCPQLVSEFGGENGTYCCDARQIHDLSTKVRRLLTAVRFRVCTSVT